MTYSWSYRDALPANGDREGDFIFKAAEADRAVQFFRKALWIAEGERAGQRYVPPPYQEHWVSALYGWRRAARSSFSEAAVIRIDDSRLPRRYRRALLGIPRSNLKSSAASGVALKALTADGRPSPHVVGAGTDRINAGIIFGYSSFSVRKSVALRDRLTVYDGTKRIIRKNGAGQYRVIAAKDTHSHGGHPTDVIVDDLQAQPHPNLLKVLRTSQINLEDSLFLMLMTAGLAKIGPGWDEWEHALDLEKDPALDPEYLVALHYLDLAAGHDWQNPEHWRIANPALGFSIPETELAKAVKRAIERPSERNEILTLHFNIWTDAAKESWIAPEQWKANGGLLDESALVGRPCFAGVVATSSIDIASVAYVFPASAEGEPLTLVLDAFVPAESVARLEDETKISFEPFFDDGWLHRTEGAVIDEAAIADSVRKRAAAGWLVQQIAWNPRGQIGVARLLKEAGLEVVAVTPGFAALSPAMRELERLVLARGVAHGGDRLLAWMFRNLRAVRTADGALRPDGEHSSGNVTGAIAAVMALSRMIAPSENDMFELQAS